MHCDAPQIESVKLGMTKEMNIHVKDFQGEIDQALSYFEKYVVCVDKTPDDMLDSVKSLIKKAIHAYETRAPGLRHGIALDKFLTIILSENDGKIPLCGIYFNLHSPYRKKTEERLSKS